MSYYIPLKDYFDRNLAQLLSKKITAIYPDFPSDSFIIRVGEQVEGLELKRRVEMITLEFHKALNLPYEEAIQVIKQILGPENEAEQGMFTNGYYLMPIAHYVERFGLDHFDLSMDALYEITKRHTSEYAIRPFLNKYERNVIEILNYWIKDRNPHVRRLVSEGTRPRLPWAKHIDVLCGDTYMNLGLLEKLITDNSPYVRKSVGNHINDLSKIHPDEVLEWTKIMYTLHGSGVEWVVKRGLRSLITDKNPDAMEILVMMEE